MFTSPNLEYAKEIRENRDLNLYIMLSSKLFIKIEKFQLSFLYLFGNQILLINIISTVLLGVFPNFRSSLERDKMQGTDTWGNLD